MKEKVSRTVVSDSAIPRTAACPVPLSVELSRQQYWSVLPFPSPGDLPNLGIKPWSPALQADSLPTEPLGKGLSYMAFNTLRYVPSMPVLLRFFNINVKFYQKLFLHLFR